MAVSHMKPPKSLWRDKNLPAAAPCPLYLHGGGFVLEAADYHDSNAMRYAKEVGCRVVFPLCRLAPQHPFPTFFSYVNNIPISSLRPLLCPTFRPHPNFLVCSAN